MVHLRHWKYGNVWHWYDWSLWFVFTIHCKTGPQFWCIPVRTCSEKNELANGKPWFKSACNVHEIKIIRLKYFETGSVTIFCQAVLPMRLAIHRLAMSKSTRCFFSVLNPDLLVERSPQKSPGLVALPESHVVKNSPFRVECSHGKSSIRDDCHVWWPELTEKVLAGLPTKIRSLPTWATKHHPPEISAYQVRKIGFAWKSAAPKSAGQSLLSLWK